MPNYVKNRLIIPNDRAAEVLAFVKGEDTLIDFNKIVPMPESLNCEDSSTGDEGMQYLLLGDSPFKTIERAQIKARLEQLKCFGEAIALGKIYLKNIAETGHKTWYGWGIDNWGTKWNAMEASVKTQEAETCLEFDTAWGGVILLMEKLSAHFPDIPFIYKYADEDTGSNCGYGVIVNGLASMTFPEQRSREAYDLAFELRPEYAENYELKDGNYVYKKEE
jgi:hypothetical protein